MYYEEINYATKDYPFLIEHKDVKYIPHFHNETELVWVMEGNLHVTIQDKTFVLKEGEICIITPDTIHNLYSHETNNTFVTKLFPIIDISNLRLINNVISPGDAIYVQLKKCLTDIIYENQAKKVGYELSVNTCANQIFLMILRNMEYLRMENSTLTKFENKNAFFNSVTEFLNEHFCDKFSIEEVASHLNYTKSYFCHYFKKVTGITFWKYYTVYRLEKAIQMMKESPEKSYAEIAENAGFKNIRSFNQSFKEYHQCTPGEYTKKYVN